MSKTATKIVIVGAGIVGAVQALLLARAGFLVTLVDASNHTQPSVDGLNVRSVALSYRSQQLLLEHELWPESAGCQINAVHVTERGKFGAVRLSAEDLDVPWLGVVIKNHLLENHLMEQVECEPAIQLLKPATATVTGQSPGTVMVLIKTENDTIEVEASLLIAADGTQSKIREDLGIETKSVDYEQHAIVANVQCQRDHGHIAYERFTDTGPLAMLPLAHKQMAMVFTTDSVQAESVINKSEADFLALIQQRFGGKLGRFEKVGRRAMFPLALVEGAIQIQDRVVFVGNSARTLHPVAGQGLNLALRDVIELSAQIDQGVEIGSSLQEFVKRRAPDQRLVVRQTDLLARVFRQQPRLLSLPLGMFRTTAMLLLDLVPTLRARFAAVNSGLDVPLSNFVASQALNQHSGDSEHQ